MARKITTININGKPYTIGQDRKKNKKVSEPTCELNEFFKLMNIIGGINNAKQTS